MTGKLPSVQPFEGIRVLGTRWSPRSYELRDFLARNHVPYQWIDVEASANDPETKRLVEALGPEAANLPVVLFPDGTKLLESVPADVAQKVGLRTRAQTDFYDLAIVGGGPAGLAAAVYGASEGLHTVMIEREAPGGQAGMSSRIENYLGFPTGLSGGDLARRAVVQAQRFGVEILSPQEAVGVRTEGPYRIMKLADGSEISCHALDDCDRSAVAAPGRSGHRPTAGCGNLLWRRRHRGSVLQGRNRLCGGRRKLGGSGGDEFRSATPSASLFLCAASRSPAPCRNI